MQQTEIAPKLGDLLGYVAQRHRRSSGVYSRSTNGLYASVGSPADVVTLLQLAAGCVFFVTSKKDPLV